MCLSNYLPIIRVFLSLGQRELEKCPFFVYPLQNTMATTPLFPSSVLPSASSSPISCLLFVHGGEQVCSMDLNAGRTLVNLTPVCTHTHSYTHTLLHTHRTHIHTTHALSHIVCSYTETH